MKEINIELVKAGYANGAAEGRPLTEKEKQAMIADAENAFGKFLDALKHTPNLLSYIITLVTQYQLAFSS